MISSGKSPCRSAEAEYTTSAAGCSLCLFIVVGLRPRGDALAQFLGVGLGQERDRVRAGGVVDDHGREPEGLLEDPALGLDVLYPHPRDQGAVDGDRPVLDVDAL